MKRLLLILWLACALVFSAAAKDRPNIVVILVDDMGWSDIGCYGSEIPTPNLDGLAKHGVRFTQFYNTGRCSPTRASLLTGHYPHQAGMGHLDGKFFPGHPGFQSKISDTSVTMAEVLGEAGYFTAMTGKWHLGQARGTAPWQRGFMRSLNLQAGGVHFHDQTGSKGGASLYLNGEEKDKNDPIFGKSWYGSYLWSEWGLKFIDEAREAKQPFFLYLAHVTPHFPLMAPQEDIDKYRGKYLVGWDKLREERRQRQIDMGLIKPEWSLSESEKNTPAWDDVPTEKRDRFDHIMSIYAAMIETMDRSVGMLVDGLRERGELDNTLLVFVSDNGGNAESGPDGRYQGENPGDAHSNVFLGQNWATLSNTPFRKWKHYVHEGGSATPLIVHWPNGIPHTRVGGLVHEPGHLIDLMTTFVSVSGASYPETFKGHAIEPMEGVSLLPVLGGGELVRENPIFFNHEDNRAVRDGKWKLVKLRNQPWELYDMEADRTELNDLAAKRKKLVARMNAQYEAWAQRTHVVTDRYPTDPMYTGNGKGKK